MAPWGASGFGGAVVVPVESFGLQQSWKGLGDELLPDVGQEGVGSMGCSTCGLNRGVYCHGVCGWRGAGLVYAGGGVRGWSEARSCCLRRVSRRAGEGGGGAVKLGTG